MRSKIGIFAIMALALAASPAYAEVDAASAAAGAAAGAVATTLIQGPNGSQLDCNALDISNMSDTDIINVRRACDSVKKAAPVSDSVKPDDVREWAGLAKEFGSAVGQTAKELGIAVNDFLMTPAGILITIYLFWSKLGGIIIGVPFLIGIWYAYYRVCDMYRRTPLETEVRPALFGLINKTVVTKYRYATQDEWIWFPIVGAIVVIAISATVICTIIL